MFNPALILTASRLFFAPGFAYFFLAAVRGHLASPNLPWLFAAIAAVMLIELSDAFDGFVARARNEVTALGKIFDPICDSLSRLTIFLCFVLVGIMPLWLFLIFMYRDGILNLIRIMNAANGTVLAAKKSGKLKAIIQALGTFLVLMALLSPPLHWGIPQYFAGRHIGFWIMLIPAAITFLSMFDYLIPSMPVIRKMATPERK